MVVEGRAQGDEGKVARSRSQGREAPGNWRELGNWGTTRLTSRIACFQPGRRSGRAKSWLPSGPVAWARCQARDTRLERTVAIKVLPMLALDPQFRERFEREAEAFRRSIIRTSAPFHDVGNHEGTEYLDGVP